jgi:hypothetical protein
VGYRGKVVEQERARQLRALGWTLLDIALELGVAKSSVSRWVRDVELDPRPRVRARRRSRTHCNGGSPRRSSACWSRAAIASGN